MQADDREYVCSICQCRSSGYGNNAWPINDGRCCDVCNIQVVAARIQRLANLKNLKQNNSELKS